MEATIRIVMTGPTQSQICVFCKSRMSIDSEQRRDRIDKETKGPYPQAGKIIE
jgi:hypothetical protein